MTNVDYKNFHELISEIDQLKTELAERDHRFAAQRSKLFDAVIEITQIARQLKRELAEANTKILELKEKLDFATAGNVHSCHSECKNPPCVLRRERDEAREALKVYFEALDVISIYGKANGHDYHKDEKNIRESCNAIAAEALEKGRVVQKVLGENR